jgi:hypothetical protein
VPHRLIIAAETATGAASTDAAVARDETSAVILITCAAIPPNLIGQAFQPHIDPNLIELIFIARIVGVAT